MIPVRFTQILTGEFDTQLDEVGLSGVELEVKARGLRRALRRFARERTRRVLRSVLRWMNVYLGTLAKVFNTAERLKELKEALEATLDDADLPPHEPDSNSSTDDPLGEWLE